MVKGNWVGGMGFGFVWGEVSDGRGWVRGLIGVLGGDVVL